MAERSYCFLSSGDDDASSSPHDCVRDPTSRQNDVMSHSPVSPVALGVGDFTQLNYSPFKSEYSVSLFFLLSVVNHFCLKKSKQTNNNNSNKLRKVHDGLYWFAPIQTGWLNGRKTSRYSLTLFTTPSKQTNKQQRRQTKTKHDNNEKINSNNNNKTQTNKQTKNENVVFID